MQHPSQPTIAAPGPVPSGMPTKQRSVALPPVRQFVRPRVSSQALVLLWTGRVVLMSPVDVVHKVCRVLAMIARDGRVIPTMAGVGTYRKQLIEALEGLA